ncbi:MAG TPA: CDP-diacylglycerol--glycerol-3-phosphate 3-phosphatidyltransferase [Caulobacteraceae bacterium]|nr:CDP-diacylglycerol--glycerol-3-phosphate 3-phosphatidyltransferase [Caulobacteraceae bacterium]
MRALPNLLTILRLILAALVFLALAAAAGDIPLLAGALDQAAQFALERWALAVFVIAAITDFFDGMLARRLGVTSLWGAILDPIADKVLVCGVILGLMALGSNAWVVLPAALILFREFTVSALREVAAGKGVTLPVTLLAKWKTTFQLTALAAELLIASWAAFGLPSEPQVLGLASAVAHALLWVAAGATVITGVQYWEKARHSLAA